jgi:hypothetical protein
MDWNYNRPASYLDEEPNLTGTADSQPDPDEPQAETPVVTLPAPTEDTGSPASKKRPIRPKTPTDAIVTALTRVQELPNLDQVAELLQVDPTPNAVVAAVTHASPRQTEHVITTHEAITTLTPDQLSGLAALLGRKADPTDLITAALAPTASQRAIPSDYTTLHEASELDALVTAISLAEQSRLQLLVNTLAAMQVIEDLKLPKNPVAAARKAIEPIRQAPTDALDVIGGIIR